MDGVLFCLDTDRYWFVQSDSDMHTWLLAQNTGFDVTVSDPKSRALQVQGPLMHYICSALITDSFKFKSDCGVRLLARC